MIKIKKFFFTLITLIVLSIGIIIYIGYKNDLKKWKIEVINESINVRENHSPHEYELGKIYLGDKYEVYDIYLEDLKFVWYKIKFEKKYAWIASARSIPYVKEYNNPDKKYRGEIEIDYKRPIIKFDEDTYYTERLKTIDYDHLKIDEDSEYTIKHFVYIEEEPKDRKGPQYWIKYIVEDEFGNKSSKIQRIIFDIEPHKSELLDFSEIKK